MLKETIRMPHEVETMLPRCSQELQNKLDILLCQTKSLQQDLKVVCHALLW